jgi:hypothetical protein
MIVLIRASEWVCEELREGEMQHMDRFLAAVEISGTMKTE